MCCIRIPVWPVADERAKEDIREFGLDQGRRLADVAADITCFVYNYKVTTALV